jgi:hypothetical protein
MCELDTDGPGHDCGRDVWMGETRDLAGAPAPPGVVAAAVTGGWTPSAEEVERLVDPDGDDDAPAGPVEKPAPRPVGAEETDEQEGGAVDDRPPATGDGGRRRGAEVMEAPRYETAAAAVDRSPSRLWRVAIGDLPSPWSAPPVTLASLVRYARDADWCAQDSVGWRRAGQAYLCFAIPVSFLFYVAAWVVQRPGRLAAAAILGLIVWLAVGR